MPVKEWFRKMQPAPVTVVLCMTVVFFMVELAVAHITHALTLLMDSYHTMCNIMALTGCLITIKYGNMTSDQEPQDSKEMKSKTFESFKDISLNPDNPCYDGRNIKKTSPLRANRENRLKNTFGWTRIDVITMLICCVFLASFSFSIYVEALQTLAHIDHQDEMHYPIIVLCVGAAGLILNGFCYLLIGGYTFHQGSFLYVTEAGDVVLNKVVVNESLQRGQRRLSRTRNIYSSLPRQRQGCWEMTRDITGCFFVMVCAIVVYFTDPEIAKFVDPAISLLSATTIMALSVPYIKESCFILLQTMPDSINIDCFKKDLVTQFPEIVNVHDFHIWQLTASKIVSTIHIIFENPKVYCRIMEDLKEFFIEKGVTQVTIQPEFYCKSTEGVSPEKFRPKCLVDCLGEACKESHCCPKDEKQPTKFRSSSTKEIFPMPEKATPTLKSVRIMEDELPSLSDSISNVSINSVESSDIVKHHNAINSRIDDAIAEESDIMSKANKSETNSKISVDKKIRLDDDVEAINDDEKELLNQKVVKDTHV